MKKRTPQANASTTTKYDVYQASDDFFIHSMFYSMKGTAADLSKAFHRGDYRLAGSVEVTKETEQTWDALEEVFDRTQNGREPWNPADPCRSTSVGDIIKAGDDYYVVAPCGFELIRTLSASKSAK